MTECACLSQKYRIAVYRRPYKWWHGTSFAPTEVQYGAKVEIVTIHGETLKEIESKLIGIQNDMMEGMDKEKYFVRSRMLYD